MKNDSLQQLLAKYQEGNLTADELQQLNQLARKDETLSAANRRAHGIIVRRTVGTVLVALTGMAVLGVGISLLLPRNEAPMIAEVKEIPTTVVDEQPAAVEALPVEQMTVAPKPKHTIKPIQKVENTIEEAVVDAQSIDEPTVICNNQCEADSVINDIWKFLTA